MNKHFVGFIMDPSIATNTNQLLKKNKNHYLKLSKKLSFLDKDALKVLKVCIFTKNVHFCTILYILKLL